jgi:hypothetical protein
MPTPTLLDTSDKVFWHGYLPFYEAAFTGWEPNNILEFGVLRGHSVRWLLQRFPHARITGADILPQAPQWPCDPRVRYVELDQGDAAAVRRCVNAERFDLVIEDGSHLPAHQAVCLVAGMAALAPGGLYILEDVHTCLTQTRAAGAGARTNALTVLLALDHLRRTGGRVVDEVHALSLVGEGSDIAPADVLALDRAIGGLALYRRSHLPDACWRCGSASFDFARLRCHCGAELLKEDDSMSFVLRKAHEGVPLP